MTSNDTAAAAVMLHSDLGMNMTLEVPLTIHSASGTTLMFAAIITATIMIVGLLGNALTIFAFIQTRIGSTTTTVFIICLCVSDLLFSSTVLPFNAIRFARDHLYVNGVACKLIPFLQYGNVGVSLLSITMITLNRYVLVVHPPYYEKIYRPFAVAVMVAFCWIFSFGMQIPTLLGKWGTYAYHNRLSTCTILPDKAGNSAKSTLFLVGFVVPCCVIVYCYVHIFVVVRRSFNRMRAHTALNSTISRDEQFLLRRRENEWRFNKMIWTIAFSFFLCYLPICIVKVTDRQVDYPSHHVFAYLLLYLSACINPLIYATMNQRYRQAYIDALASLNPCAWGKHQGGAKNPDKNLDLNYVNTEYRVDETQL